MKVALIACPAWANWAPNYALLTLEAQLLRAGHSVGLSDLNIEAYRSVSEEYRAWWKDEHSVFWESQETADRFWKDQRRFFEDQAERIAAWRPEIVALSINSGARFVSDLFARQLRKALPSVPFLAGGSDCFHSEWGTRHMIPGVVDALCPGEGEIALPHIVRAISEHGRVPPDMPGFFTWDGDKIRDNGNPPVPSELDDLAPVGIDPSCLSKYTLPNRAILMISRGCINRCAYCNESPNFGRFRTHSADWMADQIGSLLPALAACGSTPHINFNDSLINGRIDVLDRLCDIILERKLEFTWGGMAYIRKEMSIDLLRKMRRAGCVELCWGLESGSAAVLKAMRKRYDPALADRVICDAHKAGIAQYGNMIVGFPGEGPREFAESLFFLSKNIDKFTNLGLPILTPRPNSPLYKEPGRWGLASLEAEDWVSTDGKNTPRIRILRRSILSGLLDSKLFDQGRHAAQTARNVPDLSDPEVRKEYASIFDHYLKISHEYLALSPGKLPDLPEAWSTEKACTEAGKSKAEPAPGAPEALLQEKLSNISSFGRLLRDLKKGNPAKEVENKPIEIYVELTKRCNLDCPMCSHKLELAEHVEKHGRDKVDLPAEHIPAIDELLTAAAMLYTVGVGEPTLHPGLVEIVRRAAGRGVFTWVNSNAANVPDSLIHDLVQARLSRFVFSVSGGTRDRYEQYHKPAKWEKLWRTIEGFHRERFDNGVSWPQLFLNFVVMDDNIVDLPGLVGRIAPFGFAGVSVKPAVNMKGILDIRPDAPRPTECTEEHRNILKNLRESIRSLPMEWEDHSFLGSHRSQDPHDGICLHPFSTLFVSPIGDVYPCGPGEALCGDDLKIGNLRDSTLTEMWQSPALRKLRDRVQARDYLPGCRECISKKLCRLHNDVNDGLEGFIAAAKTGCGNLAALDVGDERPIRSHEHVIPGPPSDQEPFRLSAVPANGLLRRSKRANYARYVLSRIEKREIVLNSPIEIFLESANACNLNCKFCAIRTKTPRPRGKSAIMPAEIMRSVLPWLPGIASISLHGFGEPLLNRHLLDMAEAAAAHGADVDFFTNGQLLDEERIPRLVRSGAPRMTVSVSTADPALYEHLYERANFDKLRKNLICLREEKLRSGNGNPSVSFNTIITRSTLHGLPQLVEFAFESGVEAIDFKPLVTYDALPEFQQERIDYDPDRDEPILGEVRSLGERLGVRINLDAYLRTGNNVAAPTPATGHDWTETGLKLAKPCPLVFRTLYVRVDGECKPCCFASDDPALTLGNVQNRPIEDIWNGPEYRRIRRAHIAGQVPPTCSHCVKFGLAPPVDASGNWLCERGFDVPNYDLTVSQIEELHRHMDGIISGLGGNGAVPGPDLRKALPDLLRKSVNAIRAFKELTPRLRNFTELLAEENGIPRAIGRLQDSLVSISRETAELASKGNLSGAWGAARSVYPQWSECMTEFEREFRNTMREAFVRLSRHEV
ncbi:MAG: radical SAM protein [Deltaproteobacteria bacterium]|nr:radical SAM protein [Deltaproteobacteria bacterium]